LPRYISSRPLRESEQSRTPSVEESVGAVRAHAARRLAKKNWQPPKDPNGFYTRNGSAFAAQESAAEARRRQGERDD
jgi:hypothetical protein